jgi:hypothetical protein
MILTSIPTTHVHMKVSELVLNKTHDGKYIVGTIIHSPQGCRELIMLGMNPEDDPCEFLFVELLNFYFFDFNNSKRELQAVEEESGLFIGRRICLLNPYYKLVHTATLAVGATKINVVLL